jgi:hypothetical protein
MKRSLVTHSGLWLFWWITAGSLLFIGAFVVWHVWDIASLQSWLLEDGPIENATAVLYGVASLLFIVLAWRCRSFMTHAPRLGLFFMLLWAFGTFVIMGEEISWGQRILKFKVPEIVAEQNQQGEMNFHNLKFIHKYFTGYQKGLPNTFSFLMVTLGVFFPLIAITRWGCRMIQRFAFPVVPACYMVLFIGASLYGKYLHPRLFEVREFMWALGIFLSALHGLMRPWDLFRMPQPCTDKLKVADAMIEAAKPIG